MPGTDAPTVTWSQVHAFRLRRHRLTHRAKASDLVAVLRGVCGVQAQVFSAAQLALRARIANLRREDVDQALWRDRRIVKTWSLRGTLHLLPSADFRLYAQALQPLVDREKRWMRKHITEEDLDHAADAIVAALATGPLTRKALTAKVAARGSPALRRLVGSGWGGLAKVASLRGQICHGPSQGAEVTFVRAEDWLDDLEPVGREEADDRLLRAYLAAFGPATPTDYATWSGVPAREMRGAWDRIADDIVAVSIEGTPASALRADASSLRRAPPNRASVHLLPNFDSYLLAHKNKEHLVAAKHYKRVYRTAGWISAVVLSHGRVVGRWRSEGRGKKARIVVEAFARLAKEVKHGIEDEAADVARFLDEPFELSYGLGSTG